MTGEPAIVVVLRALLRSEMALQRGLGPLVADAAQVVRDLQEHHPEAFDEDGSLLHGWQDTVSADARRPAPVLHTDLLVRRIPIHLN